MLEVRGGADLGEKSIAAEDCAELRVEDFERDIALVSDVAREEDGRHAAAPDLSLDVVSPGELRSERSSELWHGRILARRVRAR